MKPKKTQKPDFELVNLNWGYKVNPIEWPKLEIHATTLWVGDRFLNPNPDILEAEIIRVIERAFGARSATMSKPRQSSAPAALSAGTLQKFKMTKGTNK